jgi:hypothetical protein
VAGHVCVFVPVGRGLTTTTLGTLLPILHENQLLAGRFGCDIFAAGAVGALFPIVAIVRFLMLLAVGGLPSLVVSRTALMLNEQIQLALLTATALPRQRAPRRRRPGCG